jgi:hypothetical protein
MASASPDSRDRYKPTVALVRLFDPRLRASDGTTFQQIHQ